MSEFDDFHDEDAKTYSTTQKYLYLGGFVLGAGILGGAFPVIIFTMFNSYTLLWSVILRFALYGLSIQLYKQYITFDIPVWATFIGMLIINGSMQLLTHFYLAYLISDGQITSGFTHEHNADGSERSLIIGVGIAVLMSVVLWRMDKAYED